MKIGDINLGLVYDISARLADCHVACGHVGFDSGRARLGSFEMPTHHDIHRFHWSLESEGGDDPVTYSTELLKVVAATEAVMDERRKAVSKLEMRGKSEASRGKLFLYKPALTTGDQLAALADADLFSDYEEPCFVMWLAYLVNWKAIGAWLSTRKRPTHDTDGLLCWAPPDRIAVVQEAIDNVPMSNLLWFDESASKELGVKVMLK